MIIHACGVSDWIVIFGRSFFMHIYNPQEYPNLLPAISLTSEEIRNLVSSYKLTFSRERNREVEWGIKLPMFVDAFYAYIVEKQSIPNQKESFDYYLQYNKDFFANLNRPDLESGIMARAFRTYPSLVRDIYFNKYIEERLGAKCQIIYNTRLDIEEGIIYSTIKLNEDEINKISEALTKRTSKKVELKNQIDESLIGGVKIVIKDRVYDSSIKYKLEQLKSSLIKKGA